MGYLFVHSPPPVLPTYVALVSASCFLYAAGTVLNDVFDRRIDARDRPDRPLPSGRVSLACAQAIGYVFLVSGLTAGGLAGWLSPDPLGSAARSALVAAALAVSIVVYDAWGKLTWGGPLAMGACRMLNVLMGMSVAGFPDRSGWQLAGYDGAQWAVAGGIGLYVAGVTWFARGETGRSQRWSLAGATGTMIAGLALLALFPGWGAYARGEVPLRVDPVIVWPMLVALLGLTVVRRAVWAVADPSPVRVQTGVQQFILSLIVFDAAIVLAVRGPWLAISVLLLLVPACVVGRWVYST
jgi:4-hydroxybenzoate polyprenyltransferase